MNNILKKNKHNHTNWSVKRLYKCILVYPVVLMYQNVNGKLFVEIQILKLQQGQAYKTCLCIDYPFDVFKRFLVVTLNRHLCHLIVKSESLTTR